MLELKDLSKNFGEFQALQSTDLTIREGEFFSLLGPSGCGKTTLMRLLGGFEQPTRGQITLDGQRIDQLAPNVRPFNMVFQRYALFPHLDVFENVAFGLRVKRERPSLVLTRVEEALGLVRMETFAKRRVSTLSGGQQQRVALARALINRPRVLLLDEPLSALDLKLRQQMQLELLDLQKKLKHTFVFVTHDQQEAMTLSDRIAVMNHGVIEQLGTPQEIYAQPKTAFVAGFIGTMNSIKVELIETRNQIAILKAQSGDVCKLDLKTPWRTPIRKVTQSISQLQFMIRPEKLELRPLSGVASPQNSLAKNSIQGKLLHSIYLGATIQYIVETDPNSIKHLKIEAPISQVYHPQVGDPVRVVWNKEDGVLMEGPEGFAS